MGKRTGPAKAVSIYLIIAYSVILLVQINSAIPQLPGGGSSSSNNNRRSSSSSAANDFDELRISNNQPAVGRSTNISGIRLKDGHAQSTGGGGNREAGVEQRITNHIGKPLVPLSVYLTPRSSQLPLSSAHAANNSQISGNSSLLGAGGGVAVDNICTAQQQYGNVCSWMSLSEFKNIPLNMNELILRDHADRASYILTMRAFIKWTEEYYFPLNNMKALPYVDHIPVLEVPDDGAQAHDPRNCSFMAASMAEKLAEVSTAATSTSSSKLPSTANVNAGVFKPLYLFKQDPIRFFEEHIKIMVDCGYLILHIQGDGYNLILKSLSFYQNPGAKRQQVPSSAPEDIDQNIQPEHLVFTTKGTRNAPLLAMPLSSRYICQRRIVLVGNNSIQLVLDRFELQKLMGKLEDPPPSPQLAPTSTGITNTKDDWVSFKSLVPPNRYKRNVAFYDTSLCPLDTSVTTGGQCGQMARVRLLLLMLVHLEEAAQYSTVC